MMRFRLALVAVICFIFPSFAQLKVDTLYYDKEWKVLDSNIFASYYRIYEVPDSGTETSVQKQFRDYYITGELQGEGYYLTLDKEDDAKSVLDGEYINYFRNGKVKEKGYRVNGECEGECFVYKESGLMKKHANFKHDKLDGIYTEFIDDGSCAQVEFKDGKPLGDYCFLSNKDGLVAKVRLSDHTPVYESPTWDERKTEYDNGAEWPYYIKNGVMVSMNNREIRDYGKYYQISLIVSNNSLFPIELDPENIYAVLTDKEDKAQNLKVFAADEYMKKVRRKQNWSLALVAISGGIAASSAGYTTSTSSSYYGGYSTAGGQSMGYASTTTTTYDAAAAYQAQVIESQRIITLDNALIKERELKNKGYLRRTTIYPGETITGYVNVERKKGESLVVKVNINGAVYGFPWFL